LKRVSANRCGAEASPAIYKPPLPSNGCIHDEKTELHVHVVQPVRLTYQPPASSTFLSEQTSYQQPANGTFLSEQISTSHQPSAKRTGWLSRATIRGQIKEATPYV
jgi:hypothetical protein